MHPQTAIRAQNREGALARVITQAKDETRPRAIDQPRKAARLAGNNSKSARRCRSQNIEKHPHLEELIGAHLRDLRFVDHSV
jgi:hypothetical protein